MTATKIRLAKFQGISVEVDHSFFVIFIILSFFFVKYAPAPGNSLTTGILTSIGFVLSMLLHELGHALVARRFRLPVRSISFFAFGGFTDLGREPSSAFEELVIALAGPVVSAMLGVALMGLSAFSSLGRINLLLTVFNMLPIFPLDGGRALRALCWKWSGDYDKATRQTRVLGRGVAYLVIAFGVATMSFPAVGVLVILIGWRLKQLTGTLDSETAAMASHHAA